MVRPSVLLFFLALSLSALAQLPVDPDAAARAAHVFATLPKKDSLKCSIDPTKPNLDFAFRFYSGYVAYCPLSEFDGREVSVFGYIRITPTRGAPVVLAESYHMTGMTPDMLAKTKPGKLKAVIEMSGGFATGEGEYRVELALVDSSNRTCHKRWDVRITRNHEQRSVPLALPPYTATEIMFPPWDGQLASRGGLRVTILLDAAPMNPSESKLRPWDRAFLLESLLSVLRQTPCSSVRLAAFNLEQQREFFRADAFDSSGFDELSLALRRLELGKVSYRVLQDPQGASRLLADLANREATTGQPSDVVIFLGPTTRINQTTPPSLLKAAMNGHSKFFYFEYFPWLGRDFPDAIHHLTRSLHGTTYQIHSPGELGKGIQKMLSELKQE